jgi:HD superfamily phosphohydrolase
MPKWGLTKDQRRSLPWGIAEKWLLPGKTITDPVHGDIYINFLEQRIIDSFPVQRLRRVRQLGTTHLVYPGATHTRFSHALGTLRAAQDLLDAVIDNRNRPRPAEDYFSEWSTVIPPAAPHVSEFDSELAKVTVLVRLGALLHDLNQVPFGHTIEDDLEVLTPHDRNGDRLEKLWSRFPDDVQQVFVNAEPRLTDQLKGLIVSKDRKGENRPPSDFKYPFVADIVGNTICADLVDYLERDHLFTGLPIALGHRFKDEFYVSPSSEVHFPKRMVIRVTKSGHERHDVTTELLKYLRYRYELSERALAQHAKLAADAMIGKLLEMRSDALYASEALRRDEAIQSDLRKDVTALRRAIRHSGGKQLDRDIMKLVEKQLERDFLEYGDDGLLERLRDWGTEVTEAEDGRRWAVGQLSTDVLNRHLYKRIGRADTQQDIGMSWLIHKKFGKRTPRRELEESAARWAGLTHRWTVVVWLPSPKMRVKIADVLVDYNGRINHLDKTAPDRAEDIYNAHQSLWGVSVYAHESLKPNEVHMVLAYLGIRLGIEFLEADGSRAPSPGDLIVESLKTEFTDMTVDERQQVRDTVKRHLVAAHSGENPTFGDSVQRARLVLESGRDSVAQLSTHRPTPTDGN